MYQQKSLKKQFFSVPSQCTTWYKESPSTSPLINTCQRHHPCHQSMAWTPPCCFHTGPFTRNPSQFFPQRTGNVKAVCACAHLPAPVHVHVRACMAAGGERDPGKGEAQTFVLPAGQDWAVYLFCLPLFNVFPEQHEVPKGKDVHPFSPSRQ